MPRRRCHHGAALSFALLLAPAALLAEAEGGVHPLAVSAGDTCIDGEAGAHDHEPGGLSLRQLRAVRAHDPGPPGANASAGLGPEEQESAALRAGRFNETELYRGAIFFGPASPDADSAGSAFAGAELFGGTPACPTARERCWNAETDWVMTQFGVGPSEVPVLSDIPGIEGKHFVLVNFNEPAKGPDTGASNGSLPQLVGRDGMWLTPPVLGTVDHHVPQLPHFGEGISTPVLLYGKHPSGFVVETHAYSCTCTIFALKFQAAEREPSLKAAGLMLGGIFSATEGLTRPTTTSYDRRAVAYLGPIAGVNDTEAFYRRQAEAKSAVVLTDPLLQVFEGDLKVYDVVPGSVQLVIASVVAANKEIYQGILQKPPEELQDALARLRAKYEEADGHATEVFLYVWLVDTQDTQSVLLMSGHAERCVAISALSKAAPMSPDVLTSHKECRPDFAVAQTIGGQVVSIPSGTCASREAQLQPVLAKALEQYAASELSCPPAADPR